MPVKNYYEILEIDANSDSKEIKSAYRKLVRMYHPDVNKDPESIELFKQINCAYETLIDPTKRNKYDILNGIFKKDKSCAASSKFNPDSCTKTSDSEKKNSSDIKTSNYYSKNKPHNNKNRIKIFDTIAKYIKYNYLKIKKLKTLESRLKPRKGKNITTEVYISVEEAITGSKRIINIRTTKTCPQCCAHRFTRAGECPKCGGSGIINETKKITVTIPKGVKNGTKLRIKNEGASSKNGGENGDIIVFVKIEVKTPIRYDKLNIYYNIPITPYEAALGEEITIPAIDGDIKLKLPKNTRSGQKFRISGQGIRKNGKIGDLIVTVSIEISHNLSDDEVKLYEQLKNLSKDDVRKNFGYGS